MINGLYNAASGLNAEMARQETVANNLANVNTFGFKKDIATFQAFPSMLVHRINDRLDVQGPAVNPFVQQCSAPLGVVGHGVQVAAVQYDLSNGTYTNTGQKLDLALEGPAMFTVELNDGTRAYTRDGAFELSADGKLVTKAGHPVLGMRGGAIQISGKDIVVQEDGRVLVDGVETDQLMLTGVGKDKALYKQGENLYLSRVDMGIVSEKTPGVEPKAKVKQGFIENSNVNVVREMVDMISVMRAYEANQRTIQVQDETLDKAVNQVGKV